jgi:NAD+ kinase
VTGTPASAGALSGAIRRIGVVSRDRAPELPDILQRLRKAAESHGFELFPEAALADGPLKGCTDLSDALPEIDLLLTLGGDGTLLRGVRKVSPFGIPVLGVNLGRLGFLTALASHEMEAGLETVLAGKAHLDPRFTVEARVIRGDGSPDRQMWALNDLVVHKGAVARVVRLELRVGDDGALEEVGSFSGDGLILATPTGSTAYSLSAGGPVIEPSMECLVATPISPHTMAMRPLVLPADVRLTVHALERDESMVITADGQESADVAPGDWVVVGKGGVRVALVRFPNQTFFDTLRRKLNWAI